MHAITTAAHWSPTQNRIGANSPSDNSSSYRSTHSDQVARPLQVRGGSVWFYAFAAAPYPQPRYITDGRSSSLGAHDCEKVHRLTDASFFVLQLFNISTLGPKYHHPNHKSKPSLLRTGPSHLTAQHHSTPSLDRHPPLPTNTFVPSRPKLAPSSHLSTLLSLAETIIQLIPQNIPLHPQTCHPSPSLHINGMMSNHILLQPHVTQDLPPQ